MFLKVFKHIGTVSCISGVCGRRRIRRCAARSGGRYIPIQILLNKTIKYGRAKKGSESENKKDGKLSIGNSTSLSFFLIKK